MSFSVFLTGTVLASSAALAGLLATPQADRPKLQGLAWAGGLGLLALGFIGGWFVAT